MKVKLLFESKLAVYITEREWHTTQEFRTRADGRVEMCLETTGRKELIRWNGCGNIPPGGDGPAAELPGSRATSAR